MSVSMTVHLNHCIRFPSKPYNFDKSQASGCKEKGTKKITYSFIDAYHSLCLDKKDIISSELEACESLLKHTSDESDRQNIESEARRRLVLKNVTMAKLILLY